MSFLNIAMPAVNFASIMRPLIGLGFLGALLLVFEPLLKGLLHTALLKPCKSLDELKASANLRSMLTLNRLAKDIEDSDPEMAAELRAIAARG